MPDADPAVRVLIVEPRVECAAVLSAALTDARFLIAVDDVMPAELPAACVDVDVLVIGPSRCSPDLAPVIPRLISSGTRCLVTAEGNFDESGSALLFAGASGFLTLRDSGPADIAAAVLSIARGSTALNPDIVSEVLLRWRAERDQPATNLELTDRERDVLLALSDGLTNRLIARRLGVAEKTVETHKSRLFVKLGVRNQAQAVGVAVTRGLL